ncbi:MAG: protein kinase, partial [Rhodothermales bacterium]|nr:protein kinase [Rhodothermales bacterium]
MSLVGKTISRYHVDAEIGQGGMGIVYRATDTTLERAVALKFLPPYMGTDENAKARFVNEAKAVSALDHPNIAVVHEIGKDESGYLFIVMAFYEGETIEELVEEGPMEIERVLDYALQTTRGLEAAHRKGIIHRDIKPGNLMVTDDGLVKILDFGLAKVQDVTMTVGAMSLGTLAYMSPEQAQGQEIDHRTDLWALGVVMYEMIAGRRPFDGPYDAAILYSAANETHEDIRTWRSDAPDELVGVVDRLLEKSPDKRYRDAAALLADLEAIRAGGKPATELSAIREADTSAAAKLPEASHPTTAADSAQSTISISFSGPTDIPWKKLGAAAAVVIGLAFSVWALKGSDDGSASTAGTAVVTPAETALAREAVSEGTRYLNNDQYDLALAAFERARGHDPEYSPAWSSMSSAYYRRGEYGKAIDHAEQALLLDPNNESALYNLALSLAETGDIAGAEDAFRDVTELNPAFTPAYSAWGDILIEARRPEDALAVLQRGAAGASGPFVFLIYKNQGKAYVELGQFETALEYLESSVLEEPDGTRWPETRLLRARALRGLGREDDARSALDEYLEIETDPGRRAEARRLFS